MIRKFVVISRYRIYVRGSMQVFRHIDVVSNADFDQMIEICLRFRAKVFLSPQSARRDEVNLKLRDPSFLEFHCAFFCSAKQAREPQSWRAASANHFLTYLVMRGPGCWSLTSA